MRAIERAVSILESFDSTHTSMALMELADRIGLSGATTLRLLSALEKTGYLIRLENRKYCLSLRVLRLAGLVDSTMSIKQVARPVMVELARKSCESVSLNTINGQFRVCIDTVDIPSPLMCLRKAGEHIKLSTGATAKTLIAHLIGNARVQAINIAVNRSKENRAAFVKELEIIKRRGYSITYGQSVLGLGGISVPIRNASNMIEYCLSVAAPIVRIKPREKMLIELSMNAADEISCLLGAERIW